MSIRGGGHGDPPVCGPHWPTEGVHWIPPNLCGGRWVGRKIDDAVKKAEDKARARDLQQATAQQAAARGEKVTAVDVDPLSGQQKVGAKALSLTANRQAKPGTGWSFARELPMREKRRESPGTSRMVRVRVTIEQNELEPLVAMVKWWGIFCVNFIKVSKHTWWLFFVLRYFIYLLIFWTAGDAAVVRYFLY